MNLEKVHLLNSIILILLPLQSFGAIGYNVKSTKEFQDILEKAKGITTSFVQKQ